MMFQHDYLLNPALVQASSSSELTSLTEMEGLAEKEEKEDTEAKAEGFSTNQAGELCTANDQRHPAKAQNSSAFSAKAKKFQLSVSAPEFVPGAAF